MARKAAQKKAQASPLDSCSVATSGRFPGTTQGALQTRITDLGGSIASKVTSDTNILIATEKDFEIKSTKVAAALDNDIPIVSLDWLDETESSNAKADVAQYSLDDSANSKTTPAPATTGNGKKRAASASTTPPAASQDASQSKKRKTLDEATKVADVKVGDGQNAKSKKIQVPVDEYCGAANYEVYIADDGLIWDASLNQTNATANNNKFYKVQVNLNASLQRLQTDKRAVAPKCKWHTLPDMDTVGSCWREGPNGHARLRLAR